MTAEPSSRRDAVATVGQRALARVIDWMIVSVVFMAVALPSVERTDDEISLPRWAVLTWLVCWLVYETGMVTRFGYTIGKLAVRVRVADARTGANPGVVRAFVRAAVGATAVVVGGASIGMFLLIGVYLTAVLDRTAHRGLNDRSAGTVIVRVDAPPVDPTPSG